MKTGLTNIFILFSQLNSLFTVLFAYVFGEGFV